MPMYSNTVEAMFPNQNPQLKSKGSKIGGFVQNRPCSRYKNAFVQKLGRPKLVKSSIVGTWPTHTPQTQGLVVI